jgi:hypothetical protein
MDITEKFYYSYLQLIRNTSTVLLTRQGLEIEYLQTLEDMEVFSTAHNYKQMNTSFFLYLQGWQDNYNALLLNKETTSNAAGIYEAKKAIDFMIDFFNKNISFAQQLSQHNNELKLFWLLGTKLSGTKIDEYREVLNMKQIDNMPVGYRHLHESGKSIYSQYEQDGVIDAIFKLINTSNKVYVEIGGGSINDNSRNLLENGWQGFVINSGNYFMNKKLNVQIKEALVTKDNINQVLSELEIPSDFDFLSIDIDSHDLSVWNAIDNSLYKPRLVSMEFNSGFPIDIEAMINSNNNSFYWDEYSKNYGSSFKANLEVAQNKGYDYVYHLPFTDVFFVREDVTPEQLKHIDSASTYDPFPVHAPNMNLQYDFVLNNHIEENNTDLIISDL